MTRSTRRHPFLRFLLTLLLVVLIAVGGFGYVLYRSVSRMGTHVVSAQESYESCLEQVDAWDVRSAAVSLRTTCTDIAQIKEELALWQWDAAAYVPVLQDDVRCARETAEVADILANDALMPVIEKMEELGLTGDGSPDLTNVPDALAKLPDLYTRVRDARSVVADCKVRATALTDSHFDQLDQIVAGVREATTQVDDAFAGLDPLFQVVDTLGELANVFATPVEEPTTMS